MAPGNSRPASRKTGSAASVSSGKSVRAEVGLLRARVKALEGEVALLKSALPVDEVIVLRTIERDQAKQEILELFRSGETLYYSDIARRLRIDLPLVVDFSEELLEAEEIEVDDATPGDI